MMPHDTARTRAVGTAQRLGATQPTHYIRRLWAYNDGLLRAAGKQICRNGSCPIRWTDAAEVFISGSVRRLANRPHREPKRRT
jgi:hypothetical protein